MVDMTNRPDVQVRLVALELLFGHGMSPLVADRSGWVDGSGDGPGSGGGTRTRDPTIMSRVLLPTELLRQCGAGPRARPASPLTDSNRRPLPYHGSALPTELRGQGPARIAGRAPGRRRVAVCGSYRCRVAHPPRRTARRRGDRARSTTSRSLESTVTFDLVPRTLADQAAWIDEHSGGHPAIVAVDDADDGASGFASLTPYRPRPAYAPTVEDSVYVHRDRRGAGHRRAAARRARRPRHATTASTRSSPASSATTTRRSPCTPRAASRRSAPSARSAASSAVARRRLMQQML